MIYYILITETTKRLIMYYPSLKEFRYMAKQGNLIPVYREILADLETPVSAFLKINKGNYSFLLESVEGGEKWARYCFLGTDPSVIFESKANTVRIIRNRRVTLINSKEGPIEALRNLMSKYRPVRIDGLPRFSGGAVGFFGYDVVRFIEKLPSDAEDDLKLPDSVFIIADTLLIFDNVKKTIKVVSNAHLKNKQIEKAYASAQKKIDILISRLKKNIRTKQGKLTSSKEIKLESNTNRKKFIRSVLKCKEYIKEGDIFQVVLSQRLKIPINNDPFDIYRCLRTLNPSPYMYYLNFWGIKIVGSSPEVMVRLEDKKVELRPIAGTRPRGKTDIEDQVFINELLADPKECAEHIMLVDLGRNDIGRISETGSVNVDELMIIEKYSHVMHIVSNINGKLKKDKDCFDVIKATFPAGTVSGAPKIRAMEIIDELEPTRRGPYAGAVGYFSFSGNMDTAISIRTLAVLDKTAYLGVGAGIVADSIPEKEFEETMNKGKALIRAIERANDDPYNR